MLGNSFQYLDELELGNSFIVHLLTTQAKTAVCLSGIPYSIYVILSFLFSTQLLIFLLKPIVESFFTSVVF